MGNLQNVNRGTDWGWGAENGDEIVQVCRGQIIKIFVFFPRKSFSSYKQLGNLKCIWQSY